MKNFQLYASHYEGNIRSELGKADYSYWFVLKYFQALIPKFGHVEVLTDLPVMPEIIDLDSEMLFCFMPPHKIPKTIINYAIPVFAWEFDTIPDEVWLDDKRNNWYYVLKRSPGAITHSEFVAETIKKKLGTDYPIAVLTAPLWDRFSHLVSKPRRDKWELEIEGFVTDSWNPPTPKETIPKTRTKVQFSGITYTFVFNPNDDRKQWPEAISAFIAAHGDNPNATLILKLIQSNPLVGIQVVWEAIEHLLPFSCRIVAIQSHLDTNDFEQLIVGTTFALNSSSGEGQCLPLLEFMSAGVPTVAPQHTAMADYINSENSIIVENTRAWHSWSHDPRMLLRCFQFPILWDSLRISFEKSYGIAINDPAKYAEMSAAATERMKNHCSEELIQGKLQAFIEEVRLRVKQCPL
jgi:glycosyltransferase involved in cell wall biosynthesis